MMESPPGRAACQGVIMAGSISGHRLRMPTYGRPAGRFAVNVNGKNVFCEMIGRTLLVAIRGGGNKITLFLRNIP